MLPYVIAYLATGLVFGALDAGWLTFMGPKIYRPVIGELLADKPALVPAIAFYLIYIAGILLLAILPNRDESLGKVAVTGALLGAMAYATYDLTNQATLKVWATKLTLLDIGWGAFVTAAGAGAGLLAWRWAARVFG